MNRKFVAELAVAAAMAGCDGGPPCSEAHFGTEIAVPATNGAISYPVERFSAQIPAGPSGVIVSIVDNIGTVAFEGRGPVPAFIYAAQPFPAIERTLYAGLGIEDGAWYPFWLYCAADGRLTRFYGEITERNFGVLTNVDGTCSPSGESGDLAIDIPAHSLRGVGLACGFSVSSPPGAKPIDLGGARPGSLELAGNSATALPFHTIDCRSGCGPQSWFEVHSVLWDPLRQNIGFAIVYLDESGVTAANGIVLPMGTPVSESFPNAVWKLEP